MLTWWGIMLDLVDTPYRGGILCLRGGVLCSASVWRIHHIKHNIPLLYGVSTTSSIISHHVSIITRLCMAYPPHQA